MNDLKVFGWKPVGKGVLKGTVSVDLGNGITLHECKVVEQGGELIASPPQRTERNKGNAVHVDLIEFRDKDAWNLIALRILEYYRNSIDTNG